MKTCSAKNIIYLATITVSFFLCTPIKVLPAVEELIIQDLVNCISDFNDTRSYVEFIDEMTQKVIGNKKYLIEYFKQKHPSLTVDGFVESLKKARTATNALSAGAALKSYYELLPKNITFIMLMNGINRRMKVDSRKS